MKNAILTLAVAGTAACASLADTLTVQPLGGPADPIYLSENGTLGVRPQESFWSFPDTYTPLPDVASALRVSPDGQWALGSSATNGLAARFSRTGGADVFQLSTNGTTPNTAYASSSGNMMVVGAGTSQGGSRRAFRWAPGTGTVDLGVFGTDLTSTAVDVSSSGDVIVGYGDAAPPSSLRRAVRWTSGGTNVERLDANGGGSIQGEATAVSANGQVIVGITTRNGVQRGFRWTALGRDIDLASPASPGSLGLPTRANDVSADGTWTVGEADSAAGMRATMWNAAGEGFFLHDILSAAGLETEELFELRSIHSVSGDGRTVSGIAFDLAAGQLRAFVATLTFSTGGGDCDPDLGGTGGTQGSDGTLDNNDFVVFVDSFFVGCE